MKKEVTGKRSVTGKEKGNATRVKVKHEKEPIIHTEHLFEEHIQAHSEM